MKSTLSAFALLVIVSCSNPDHFSGRWKGISEHAADTLLITKTGTTAYSVQLMGNPAQEAILKNNMLEFGKPEFKMDIRYDSANGHLQLTSQAFTQPFEFIKL